MLNDNLLCPETGRVEALEGLLSTMVVWGGEKAHTNSSVGSNLITEQLRG